jgi:Fic family protein
MMLYLILTKKLDYPVLFISEYINKTRSRYYDLLNQTNRTDDYTDFVMYILEGITAQALLNQQKIIQIKTLMEQVEQALSKQFSADYHKITKILFSFPYSSASGMREKLEISRQTMTRYVPKLEASGLIKTIKVGRNSLIYIPDFIALLS